MEMSHELLLQYLDEYCGKISEISRWTAKSPTNNKLPQVAYNNVEGMLLDTALAALVTYEQVTRNGVSVYDLFLHLDDRMRLIGL